MRMFGLKLNLDLPTRIRNSSILVSLTGIVLLCTILGIEGTAAWESETIVTAFHVVNGLFVLATLYAHYLRLDQAIFKTRYLKSIIPDGLLLVLMGIAIANAPALALASVLNIIYHLGREFKRTGAGQMFANSLMHNPAMATALSFIGTISGGTLLLMLPRSSMDSTPVSFVDALFTATSANCVTGLAVINTSLDAFSNPRLLSFSPFGQAVILFLIQIGGLGIMTFTSASLALMSGRLLPKERAILSDIITRDDTSTSIPSLFRSIFFMTFAFEIVGTIILSIRFLPLFPGDVPTAVWYGFFHAVSAFCNAGFSLFSTNLAAFQTDPVVNLTVMTLIVFGGIGFPVIAVLFSKSTWARGLITGIKQMPVHSRLVIRMTLILIVGGALLLFIADYNGAQANLSTGQRIWSSFFQSVSSRTAGFNTIDIGLTSKPAVMVYVLLMFIGASPGGTGGGIKTTTFALLVLSVQAALRRRDEIHVFNRQVSADKLQKVVVLSFIALATCFIGTVLLEMLQPNVTTEQALFETVSAFGTVGLSMNLSPTLNDPAKLLVTLIMYIGRIGPLTITLALAKKASVKVSYPEGRILVG
jgi:trk system potassium uptake protein TrkH